MERRGKGGGERREESSTLEAEVKRRRNDGVEDEATVKENERVKGCRSGDRYTCP